MMKSGLFCVHCHKIGHVRTRSIELLFTKKHSGLEARMFSVSVGIYIQSVEAFLSASVNNLLCCFRVFFSYLYVFSISTNKYQLYKWREGKKRIEFQTLKKYLCLCKHFNFIFMTVQKITSKKIAVRNFRFYKLEFKT